VGVASVFPGSDGRDGAAISWYLSPWSVKGAQSGFALMMALVFLLLISMLSIAASQHALLQERMAGSLRNAQQARMSAETALRGAEYKVWSTAGRPGTELQCLENAISPDGCVIYRSYGAPYKADGDVTRFQSAQGWIADIGIPYKGPAGRGYTNNPQYPTAKLAEDPRYIIEDLGSERPPGVGGLHESGSTGPNNGDQGGVHIYRITARATGGRTGVVSVVQSTFDAPASR
jgi:type IV pilus assembly protein PilX